MKNLLKRIRSFFYLLPNILKTLLRSPETTEYPNSPPHLPARFRGEVRINAENCTGCSLCARDCPAGALELIREAKKSYRLVHYRDRCTYCGHCEYICKFNAIYLENDYVTPSADKEDFIEVLVNKTDNKEDS